MMKNTANNNADDTDMILPGDSGLKSKANNSISMFLRKTYKMIDTCDSQIASWTADGEMFVVKNPRLFETTIIPQYFDHSKLSSFARQLNFYGFTKMQSKPVHKSEYDTKTAKYLTFYHEKFKKGRCDLLIEIRRSTRTSLTGSHSDNSSNEQDCDALQKRVDELEEKIEETRKEFKDCLKRTEVDFLSRMEQMFHGIQQPHQQPMSSSHQNRNVSTGIGLENPTRDTSNLSFEEFLGNTSYGTPVGPIVSEERSSHNTATASQLRDPMLWSPIPVPVATREGMMSSSSSHQVMPFPSDNRGCASAIQMNSQTSGATLEPHPNQKMLPPQQVLPRPLSSDAPMASNVSWGDRFLVDLMSKESSDTDTHSFERRRTTMDLILASVECDTDTPQDRPTRKRQSTDESADPDESFL
eukprot:scaffold30724_cov44-Attheya_sp.AAC.2